MATAASALSFQGLVSGIQTDALVSAILAQEGQNVTALKAKQTQNGATTSALTAMKSDMNALLLSLATVQDQFNSRTVTSTDTNNTYVTATATGAASGTYDLTVGTVATKGRISPTMVAGVAQNLAVANPADAIFTSPEASFAVQGTDGVIKTFQLTNNSLNGFRDAINASGAGVTASIVNTGSATNPYQLVVTANATGTGSTGGVVTLAAIDNANDGSTTTVNAALGITAGSLGVDPVTHANIITGGLTSDLAGITAKDASFSLNGIQYTRQTNAVTDAAEGVTFNLKQGGQTGTTSLTVAPNTTAAAAGLQDVLTKYNAMLNDYKGASTSTQNTDGSIKQGPLAGDPSSRTIMSQIRSALTGVSAGMSPSTPYSSLANLGVRTNSDGTLSLDNATFQAAIQKDPNATLDLFTASGDSSNGVVAFQGSGATTATGAVTFTIDSYSPGGAVSGTFSGTTNGTPFSVQLTGSNGTLIGGAGPLSGLTLAVTGTGSGTLTLKRGAGQAASDLISKLTAGSGALTTALANIQTQNVALATQINSGQAMLDRRKLVLEKQFSDMEVAVAQMKAAASSLVGA
jgi:flagellar hook-associated protein 2